MTQELVREVRCLIYELNTTALASCSTVEAFHRLKGKNEAAVHILRWMNTTEAESLGHIQTGEDDA